VTFFGCEFADENILYNQKLVVYANLSAGFPMGALGDTCYVSLSSGIEEETNPDDLYVSGATVSISKKNGNETFQLNPVTGRQGRYLTDSTVVFESGETYVLNASYRELTITAETTVPIQMNFSSPPNETYNCDGERLPVHSVITENLDLATLVSANSFEEIFEAIDMDSISEAVYKNGGCYTESFASFPLFLLDYMAEEGTTVKVLTFALEADKRGLEPFDDLNGNGSFDDNSDTFMDFNRNGMRDSTFSNLIYDTTIVYKIWKERYLRDKNNDPYRINPSMWQVGMSPVSMNWLIFNYYGIHIITLEATDQAYHDYYAGDPVAQNQFVLPTSNIIDGYGLFSSTTSKSFLVNIVRDENLVRESAGGFIRNR